MHRCHRLLLSALALFAFASTTVSRVFAGEPQWIEIQSPHFSVITDAGEKRGREAAMRFEQMRAVFGALMTKANVNTPVPLQIVAFRNNKELREVAPLWHGKPIQLAGLFESGGDRSFIMLDMSVDSPWKVVFHEYAHELMNGVLTVGMDPWFQEGFAEYFSSIDVDNKEAKVGKVKPETYQVLEQQRMMKIADLLRVQHDSSTYNENGDRRTVFYAESCVLVHYLYDHNLIPKLAEYFTLKVDKGLPVEDAIQQGFGMSASQFDNEIQKYFNADQFRYYSLPTPANIVSKDYSMKALRLIDAKVVLADIHAHSPDYREKAEVEFQQILKDEPGNAAANRGLGYAYLQKRDFTKAGEYFKLAAQADSKDPRVHYLSALLINNNGALAEGSNLADMTKELETAIALDPGFADAYALLGFARMRAGDNVAALTTMQKAVSLSPRNENYLLNFAQMYLSAGQQDKAVAILQALQRSSDQQIALRAGDILRNIQRFQSSTQPAHPVGALSARVISDRAALSGPVNTENTSDADTAKIPNNIVPIKFLKGTILAVDCSAPPSAIVKVISEGKTWAMRVPDSKHVAVIGEDELSCGWNKQKVFVNYRETGEMAGTVVSIEIE